MKIKYDTIPQEIKDIYNLQAIEQDGYVYIELQKGMYELKQAGILVNLNLEKLLLAV